MAICYRDIAFCSASTDGRCVNRRCGRFFSASDREQADEWWGGGSGAAPVAFGDFSAECEQIQRATDPVRCVDSDTSDGGEK